MNEFIHCKIECDVSWISFLNSEVDIVAGPDAYRDLPNLIQTTESGSQVRSFAPNELNANLVNENMSIG